MSVGASKNETVGISSTEEVGYIKSTIVGEEYTITVGNSTIHMSAEGSIEITATNFQVVASEYVEIKGKKVCVNGGCEGEKKGKVSSVQSDEAFDEHFIIKDPNGIPMSNMKYKIKSDSGTGIEGITDEFGKTELFASDKVEDVELHYIEEEYPEDQGAN